MEERRERRRDVWLETGRQIVDGVSGRRPGQRRSSLDLESVGRWVGDKVDWLLEEDDDWREPWQESTPRSGRRRKRPLEAISRRQPQAPPTPIASPPDDGAVDAWPEDDSFRVDRWQRSRMGQSTPAPAGADAAAVAPRRSPPRSSRRRS